MAGAGSYCSYRVSFVPPCRPAKPGLSTAGEGWDRHTAKPQQIHPSAGCCWGDSPSIGVPGGPYGPQKLRLDGLMAMGCSAAIANDLNASQSHFCSQSSLEKNIFNSTQYLIEGDKVISTSLVFPFAQSLKGQQQWRASAPTINGAYFLSWTVIAGVASRGGGTRLSLTTAGCHRCPYLCHPAASPAPPVFITSQEAWEVIGANIFSWLGRKAFCVCVGVFVLFWVRLANVGDFFLFLIREM